MTDQQTTPQAQAARVLIVMASELDYDSGDSQVLRVFSDPELAQQYAAQRRQAPGVLAEDGSNEVDAKVRIDIIEMQVSTMLPRTFTAYQAMWSNDIAQRTVAPGFTRGVAYEVGDPHIQDRTWDEDEPPTYMGQEFVDAAQVPVIKVEKDNLINWYGNDRQAVLDAWRAHRDAFYAAHRK